MQDALVGATDKKNSQHEKDGEVFYDYEVTGAVSKHLLFLLVYCPGAPKKVDKQSVNHGINAFATIIVFCRTCITLHPLRLRVARCLLFL